MIFVSKTIFSFCMFVSSGLFNTCLYEIADLSWWFAYLVMWKSLQCLWNMYVHIQKRTHGNFASWFDTTYLDVWFFGLSFTLLYRAPYPSQRTTDDAEIILISVNLLSTCKQNKTKQKKQICNLYQLIVLVGLYKVHPHTF